MEKNSSGRVTDQVCRHKEQDEQALVGEGLSDSHFKVTVCRFFVLEKLILDLWEQYVFPHATILKLSVASQSSSANGAGSVVTV